MTKLYVYKIGDKEIKVGDIVTTNIADVTNAYKSNMSVFSSNINRKMLEATKNKYEYKVIKGKGKRK